MKVTRKDEEIIIKEEYTLNLDRAEYLVLIAAMGKANTSHLLDSTRNFNPKLREEMVSIIDGAQINHDIYEKLVDSLKFDEDLYSQLLG